MKKKILLLALLSFIFHLSSFISTYAASPTPSVKISATPAAETSSETINSLKERIASRVAQLKLVERRGALGKVSESTQTQITLSDAKDNIRFIDVDELTKFASPSANGTFGISDISKNMNISVLGLYNKQSRRLLARFINVVSLPKSIHGAVTDIDSENFIINVVSDENQKYIVDIENVTKTSVYVNNSGLERSGFSKIKKGERVIVIGFLNLENKNRLTATRILRFPDVPNNPNIKIENIEPSISARPNSQKTTPTPTEENPF